MRRVIVLFGAWLVLLGPTPGSVGSCDGDGGDRPASFARYCRTREELICVRRALRLEITVPERDACRWDAVDACKRRTFPADCHPTERQAQACLNALASFDTLATKESELPECNTHALCSAPAAEPDAGAFAP